MPPAAGDPQFLQQRHHSLDLLETAFIGERVICQVSPSTVKSILYGKSRNPGVVTIKLLCDGLEISLEEFFSGPEFASLEPELK